MCGWIWFLYNKFRVSISHQDSRIENIKIVGGKSLIQPQTMGNLTVYTFQKTLISDQYNVLLDFYMKKCS